MINILEFLPKKYVKNEKLKIIENIYFYVVLCLWSVVSLLFSELRNYNELAYSIIIICIIEIVLTGTLYLDIRELILVMGWFFLYSIEDGHITFEPSILLVFEFFFLGKMFVLNAGKSCKKRIIQIFSVMAISMSIGSMLDFTNFDVIPELRTLNWYRFWSGRSEYCTHYAFYVIPISCLLFWALCTFRRHILLSIVIVACVVVVNYEMLLSYTRMDALITVLVFGAMAIVYFIKNHKKKKVQIIYGIITALSIIAIVACTLYVVSNEELNKIVKATLNRDDGIVHNIRFEFMAEVIKQLPSHPFGGIDIGDVNLAHNLWLDIARTAGFIPFILIIVYSALCLIDAMKCLLKTKDSSGCRYFIVALFLGLNLYYMIEPTFIVSMYFVAIGCMVSGSIRAFNYVAINENSKERKKRKRKKGTAIAGVLAVFMLLTGCSVTDAAIAKPEDTDEYVDDGEYDDVALIGSGTKEDPYLINDYNDLIYFYNAVNTGWLFEGKYLLQTNDIDMSEHPFWPIAEYTTPYSFLGTYDGGGHVIENACLYTEYYSAIFGKLGGTVMNLGVIDGYIQGWKAAGIVGICTSHDAKILNCYSITTLDGKEVAGIVSSASGMVEGCFSQSYLGGEEAKALIYLGGDGKVNRCYGIYDDPVWIKHFYIADKLMTYNMEDALSFAETADKLNEALYNMSIRSGVPMEDFCLWKVTPDGGSIRLTTTKADAQDISEDVNFRIFLHRNYPYSPIVIGVAVTVFVVFATWNQKDLKSDKNRKNRKTRRKAES